MYLNSIRIQNFRCLRDVSIDFEPLTVLVGPNGSGKTAILDALNLALGNSYSDYWRHDTNRPHRRSGVLANGQRFDIMANGQTLDGTSKPRSRYAGLHLSPPELRRVNPVQAQQVLVPNGSNLANLFATLPRRTQEQVARRLCELVPLYQDVDVRPNPGHSGVHRIVFQDKWDESLWFEPAEVSDGTIVLLALLTLAHLDPAPDLLAIEEPEHALHPFLLGEVVKMLRSLATGDLGPKAVQVILATHSAELLDFVEPREVRFVSRNLEDGSTRVGPAPLDTEQWKAAYEEYESSLGNLWLSGGLGGVPGSPAQ